MAYRNREEEKLERREEQDRKQDEPGPKRNDNDRGKKTFAERDKAQRGPRDDRDARPQGKRESAGYRSYKSKLDKLFDGEIKLPSATVVEVVKKEVAAPPKPTAPPPAAEPTTPRDALKAAESPADIAAAARACLAADGLPRDNELLAKVLLVDDEALLIATLDAILDAMERGRPKNAKLIAARVADRQASLKDPHAIDIAAGIRARLG